MHARLAELIQCPSLSIAKGRVEITSVGPANRTVNSKATYICDDDYLLKGNVERLCLMNGTWSGENPICGKFDLL